MKSQKEKKTIDFVISWVDGNDPEWQKEKGLYERKKNGLCEDDNREARYRDWDNLQYLFRGIEQFAPWVRTIHFVTWGHVPKWLNTRHPKLHIVNHRDYIPGEFLPTFNSNTIEWNLHRIDGLSSQFVYFNDDIFMLQKISPDDFFKDGKPVDMLALQPDVANVDDEVMPYIYLNNAMFLAKYFNKKENMKKQPAAYFHLGYPPMYFCYNLLEVVFPRFTGFYTVHGPSPLLKDTYQTLWNLEPQLLDEVCKHKFRSKGDVNQYVIREYQKLSGNFYPKNIQAMCGYYEISNQNEMLVRVIKERKKKFLCLNDANQRIEFEQARTQINQAFEQVFPRKCSFEL